MDDLISKNKLLEWLNEKIKRNQEPYNDLRIERAIAYEDLEMLLKSDAHPFFPDTLPTLKPGDGVYHRTFKASGTVKKITKSGIRALVYWHDGAKPSYVGTKNLEVVSHD